MVMGEGSVLKILGSNLKFLREREDLTQRDVCIVLEISPQTYSGWENGRHAPALNYLLLFSRFYGVSVDYLLNERRSVVSVKRIFNKLNKVR